MYIRVITCQYYRSKNIIICKSLSFNTLRGRTSILRRWARSQLSSDTFGKPLVEVSLLTVDLPVLLLLQVDRPPLVVGHESILDLGTEVAAPQGGDHFADGRVRVGLGVADDFRFKVLPVALGWTVLLERALEPLQQGRIDRD